MAKDPPRNTKSDRLSKAVEEARAQPKWVLRTLTPSRNVKVAKPAQRAIKYPNTSTALRQYVVEARKAAKPFPAVRLRVGPPRDPMDASAPEPARARTFTALRATATERAPQTPMLPGRALVQAEGPTAIGMVSELGEIVRRARRRLGLSQAELAALAGTGRRFVSEVEAGKPTVEFERLLKVCNALGVSLLAASQTDDR